MEINHAKHTEKAVNEALLQLVLIRTKDGVRKKGVVYLERAQERVARAANLVVTVDEV